MNRRPPGLGDFPDRRIQPQDGYWDSVYQAILADPQKDIVKPKFNPPSIPGMKDVEQVFDCRVMPRLAGLLWAYRRQLQCGTYFVKDALWHQSPPAARRLDLFTDLGVTMGVDVAPGATEILIFFTNPKRFQAILNRQGMELEVPSGNIEPPWGFIDFSIELNEAPSCGVRFSRPWSRSFRPKTTKTGRHRWRY